MIPTLAGIGAGVLVTLFVMLIFRLIFGPAEY